MRDVPDGAHGRRIAALIIGLTFWWPFFRKFEYSALFGLYPNPADAMWAAYTPTMLLLAVALLFGTAARTYVEALLAHRRPLCCLLALTTTLGLLTTYFAPEMTGASVALHALGCVFIALGYATLTLCWGSSLSKTSAQEGAAGLAVGFALSTATQLASFLPTNAMLGIAIASPAISALAWLSYEPPLGSEIQSPQQQRQTPIAVIAMLGCFLVAGRIAVGLLSYTSDAIPTLDRIVTVVGTIALVVCLIAAAKSTQDWGRLFQVAWSGLAILFMAGMFALLVGNDFISHLATSILSCVLGCFELILFVVLTINTGKSAGAGVATFGAGIVLFRILPNFAGKNLTPVLIGAEPAWAQQLTALVVPAMTFLLVAATIVFMNARIMGKVAWLDGASQANAAPDAAQERSEQVRFDLQSDGRLTTGLDQELLAIDTCQSLASQHGLTPRETDVLRLMAEGRSYQKIADTLGISLGTVQGHVKCVYRKLDVHTKQEIIELVK